MEKEKIDYEEVGLKCGLEIHQQLSTHKLFCNCPNVIRDDKPDFEVKRELRAVVGETGEIDAAAAHEQSKKKKFHYQGYTDTTCLVEIDEEPPHLMNKEALDTVLQASLLLNSKIVDEVQIMRKTVVDGSNTAGFQRTALVARNGYINVNGKRIGVPTISIEEDACKIVKRDKEFDIYNLSRLGIPLIEIGTDPDMNTPDEAREVAEKIGMILRSTGKVMRGLGTIRQDVNVSIKGGVRVEIKGAQDLRMILKLVENEVLRQKFLLNFPKNILISKTHDLSKILSKTESKVLRKSLDNNGIIIGVKIEEFHERLKKHISPGKRLGAELSDYAKSIAGIGGLFHSDELPNYGITEEEVELIKKELHVKENDAFIIIADNKTIAEKAIDAVKQRLSNPLTKEVRKANEDGTTSFMRPMPGSARMYPETDTIPVIPDVKHIKLPELIEDKIKRFEKEYKLSNDLATQIVKAGIPFEDYTYKFSNISPIFIADTLISAPKEIKKRYDKDINVEANIDELFSKLNNNEITKDAVFEILIEISHERKVDYSRYKAVDEKHIEEEIKRIIEENKGKTPGTIMGLVMAKFRGKVDGKKVSELVNRYLK